MTNSNEIDSLGSKIQINRIRPLKIGKIDFSRKPLEQETCDDCISRHEAINSLGECPMNWTDSDGEITAERDWKDTVEMLKRLPSVIPQPKTEVFDKIRAEIEHLTYYWCEVNPKTVIDDVLQIIDKYKAESEDNE